MLKVYNEQSFSLDMNWTISMKKIGIYSLLSHKLHNLCRYTIHTYYINLADIAIQTYYMAFIKLYN